MKNLEFNYNDTTIHFEINPMDKNLMVNATEMAKVFNKKTELFMKADHTKKFISALEKQLNLQPNGGRLDQKIVDNRGRLGIFFDRRLALKFAAWLSPEFEVWIFSTMDEIIFGNYQKHWEAHAAQEEAKIAMENIKQEIMENPTKESVQAYFNKEQEYKRAKSAKTWAIRNQLKLFSASE